MSDIEVQAEIKTFQPRPAKFNGDGDEIEPPKLAITFLVPMDAIGSHITRIAWMFRHGVQPELTISGPEQLTHGLARRNGHDAAAKVADAMVDMVDEIPLGKGIDSITVTSGSGKSATKRREGAKA